MRKEFVYSLLAVGGAFPVTIQAAVVNADAVKADKDWSNKPEIKDGIITVAKGETAATAKLVKGSYTLKVKVNTLAKDVTVALDGASAYDQDADKKDIKEVKLTAAGEAVINFTLNAEQTVTIKLNSEGQYTFEPAVITLNFDFAAAVADVEKNYLAAVAVINTYEYNNTDEYKCSYDKNADLLKATTEIGVPIDEIKNATAADGYKIYTDKKLYEASPAAITAIQTAVDALASKALKSEIAYQTLVLQKQLDDLKTGIYDKLSAYAKGVADAAKKNEVPNQGITISSVQKNIDNYKVGSSVDKSNVEANIQKLEANLKAAQALDGDNDADYQAVKDAIETAKNNYTAQNTAIQEAMPYESYTKVKSDEAVDIFKNLRADAAKKMADELVKVNNVVSQNEASHDNGTSGKDRAAYETTLNNATAAINSIAAEYLGYAATLQAAIDEIAADSTTYNERTAAIAAQIAADKDVADDAAAALKAIRDFETKAINNATTADINKLNDISSDHDKIAAALKKLIDGANLLNYNAYKEMVDKLTELGKAFDDAKAEVAAYAKNAADDKDLPGVALAESEYNPATYWAKTIEFLERSTRGAYGIEIVKKAYNNKYAVNFKNGNTSSTYSVDGTNRKYDAAAVENYIKQYLQNAKAAAKQYADVKAKKEDYQKQLSDLEAEVKKTDVYTKTGPANSTTYKAQIEAVQKKINDLNTKLENAKKQVSTTNTSYNQQHWTWVKANLKDDASIQTDIDKIKDSYEAAQKAWENQNLITTIDALTAAIDEKMGEVGELVSYIKGLEYSAASKADIVDKQLADIEKTIPTEEDIKAAVDNDKLNDYSDPSLNNLKVKEIASNLDKILEELNTLKEKADAASQKYVTNEKNYATAQAKVTSLLNELEKQRAAAETNDADVYATGAIGDKTGFANQFAAIKADIEKMRDETIKKDYEAEKLTEDTYKAEAEKIEKAIKDTKDKADAAQANYAANERMEAVVKKVEDAIAKAKEDVKDADPDQKHATELLTKTYQDELDALKTSIDKAYNGKTAVADEKDLTAKLNTLLDKVNKVVQDAKDNLEAYNAQTKALDDANTQWNETYKAISESNESSKLPEFQETLTTLREQLKTLADEVEKGYVAGESTTNGKLAEIQDIQKQIKDINDEALNPEKYNKQIAEDNKNMIDAVEDALAKAQQAYTKAAESIKSFREAESDLLKNAMDAVAAETEVLSQAIKQFPTDIAKVRTDAWADYYNTDSPTVFDKEKTWIAKANEVETNIAGAEKAFLEAIKDAISTDLGNTVSDYNSQVAAAKNALDSYRQKGSMDYTSNSWKNTRDAKFNAVNQLIKAITTAQNNMDINALDKALLAAGNKQTGVAESINIIKNAMADEVLGGKLTSLESNRDWLTADKQNTISGSDRSDKTGRLDNLRSNYNAYNAARTLDENFDAVLAEINELNNYVSQAKSADNAYKTMLNNLSSRQNELTAAYAEADKYVAGSDIRDILDALKDQLEDIAEKAKTALEDRTTGTLSSKISSIRSKITTAVNSTLWDKEWAKLDGSIADLEAQYVLYAADFNQAEQAATYKAQIESLKTRLNDTQANHPDHSAFDAKSGHWYWYVGTYSSYWTSTKTPSYLLPYQAEIANLLTALRDGTKDDTDYYKSINAEALKALNDAVAELEANANLNGVDETVQADMADDLKEVTDQIDNLKKLIAQNEDNIAFYQENYNGYVNNIQGQIDQLKKDATDADKALKDARQAAKDAYDSNVMDLDAVKAIIQEAKDEIDGWQFTKSSDFRTKFNQLDNQVSALVLDQPDEKASKTDADKYTNETAADDAKSINALKEDVEKTIADVKNTAANKELRGILDDLKSQVEDFKKLDEDNFTIGDWKLIQSTIEAVSKDIEALEKAIDEAKTAETSYENLTKDGKDGKLKTDADAIQKKIDDLKDEVGLNSLAPTADINGDGKISVQDYTLLLNAVLASSTDEQYDLNQDGEIDVTDIVLWVDAYRSNDTDAARAASADRSNDKAALTVVGTNEGITRLALTLTNADSYRAMQLDTRANVKNVSKSDRTNGMGAYSKADDFGSSRIVVSSMYDKRIAAGEGAVVYIDVENYNAQDFTEVSFVNAAGQLVTFDLRSGAATAIDGMAVSESFSQKVYNMGGRLMNGLKKGINIIRGNDGQSKKVVVK